MARREYITRQIAMLLEFAKTTTNPNIAAAMVGKAADLKARGDLLRDLSPHAPDVEPPAPN